MGTRASRFELKTESANFCVDEDVVVDPGGPRYLVYCSLNHKERGNGYGDYTDSDDDRCGLFYVAGDDLEAFCIRFLAERGRLSTPEQAARLHDTAVALLGGAR